MKATILKPVDVNITHLKARIGVRYWEDSLVNGVEDTDGKLIPLRDGEYWCITIDIDTGIIQDWKIGTTANVHYKCCDDGDYSLIADDGCVVEYPKYYVPKILDLTEEGFGDYVIMDIDENGKIANWDNNPNIDDFFPESKYGVVE